jgi:hypothetical protein
MLGVAMVTAVAAMAFVGAGTASAVDHLGYCAASETLCAAQNLYVTPAGGRILALALSTNAELKNNAFFKTAEKCAMSTSETETLDEKANPLKGSVVGLSFTECTGPCKKVESKGLPWEGQIEMTEEMGDWVLKTSKGGALLSECTFGTKCEYGVPVSNPVDLLGSNTSEEGAQFKAEEEELEYKSGSGSGICGSTGTWTATYTATQLHLRNAFNVDVGLHSPWYNTLLP